VASFLLDNRKNVHLHGNGKKMKLLIKFLHAKVKTTELLMDQDFFTWYKATWRQMTANQHCSSTQRLQLGGSGFLHDITRTSRT
jgi:hypothetical protein